MTLEEYIEALAKHQKCDVNKCIKFNCSECEFAISMDKVPTDKEILGYFEELKSLRVELEKNSKELDVYKKALKLTCDELFRINNFCIGTDFYKTCVSSRRDCKDCWKEYYLQKAREQNDEKNVLLQSGEE